MPDRSWGRRLAESWMPVLITVMGWVFIGGMAYQNVTSLEKRVIRLEGDHDILMRVDQKVDDLLKIAHERKSP